MVNKRVLAAKCSAIEHHLARIIEKRQIDLNMLLTDLDRQESILFNFQMAIQNCIDIAAHLVSEEEFGIPGSANELFYLLEEHTVIDSGLTEKMVQAVGFRNLIVHEYGKLDLAIVYRAAWESIEDLREFMRAVLGRFVSGSDLDVGR
jgi:uncharacterized protein YutE (UPF0331/DUF86 family)